MEGLSDRGFAFPKETTIDEFEIISLLQTEEQVTNPTSELTNVTTPPQKTTTPPFIGYVSTIMYLEASKRRLMGLFVKATFKKGPN